MHRSIDKLTQWISTLVDFDPNTVMFCSLNRVRRGTEQCSVNLVVPLSEKAATEMLAGRLDEKSFTGEHLQRDAQHVFVQALALKSDLSSSEIKNLSILQRNALMYQMAKVFGDIRKIQPAISAIIANEENGRITVKAGLRIVKPCMPITGKKIAVLESGARKLSKQYLAYLFARITLRRYQKWQRKHPTSS